MNQADMRSKFMTRGAAIAGSLRNEEKDAYLDAAYQYGVSAVVSGSLTDGFWEFDTVASTQTYAYEDQVYEVKPRGHRCNTQLITPYFREDVFEFDHSDTSAEQLPYAALFYGRTVKLYPTPDAIYSCKFPARLFPENGLTSDGLENHNHAMAVICEAVVELADDYSNDALMKRAQGSLDNYLSRLRGQSHARPLERQGGLSF